MIEALVVVIAVAAAPAAGEGANPPDLTASLPGARAFTFVDEGVVRVVVRGAVRGTDEARVDGVFEDPGTGRIAPVTVGASVIVRRSDVERVDSVVVGREIFRALDLVLVKSLLDEDALELAERLSAAGVDVYPDLAFRQKAAAIEIPPNDPRYGGQFYLDEIDIEDAWAISTGSADISVLVADNGCDMQHPDLAAKIDPGVDPIEDDGDPSFVANADGNEHGTACAGIIAAIADNDIDIAGTCPECRLRCGRLLPSGNEAVPVDADVLVYGFAQDNNVAIVSNSWGFVDAIPVPTPLKNAIEQVQQRGRGGLGTVVVFASGNDDRVVADDELLAVRGILGVGAVNNLGELTQFSNGGNSLDVVAPTGTVTTDIAGADGLDPGDVTSRFGGTSSACPIVSGIAGLILAHKPDASADDVNNAIASTAKQSAFATPDDTGHDQFYGFGLVQPAKALAFFDPAAPDNKPGGCGGCASAAGDDAAPWSLAFGVWMCIRRRRRARS